MMKPGVQNKGDLPSPTQADWLLFRNIPGSPTPLAFEVLALLPEFLGLCLAQSHSPLKV